MFFFRSAGDGVYNAHIRGPSLLGSDTHSSPRRKDKHTAVETIFSDTASDDENDGEEYEIVSRYVTLLVISRCALMLVYYRQRGTRCSTEDHRILF